MPLNGRLPGKLLWRDKNWRYSSLDNNLRLLARLFSMRLIGDKLAVVNIGFSHGRCKCLWRCWSELQELSLALNRLDFKELQTQLLQRVRPKDISSGGGRHLGFIGLQVALDIYQSVLLGGKGLTISYDLKESLTSDQRRRHSYWRPHSMDARSKMDPRTSSDASDVFLCFLADPATDLSWTWWMSANSVCRLLRWID